MRETTGNWAKNEEMLYLAHPGVIERLATALSPTPSVNVEGSGKASDNITWINIALGEWSLTFYSKSDKV